MDNKITISIIMPVYNAEKFLEDAINDILSQSKTDFELICVDDGSTDRSVEIIATYCNSDSRVVLIQQENRGAGAARNRGMDIAKGEYLFFLDSDDRFEKDMLELAYDKITKLNADIVIFSGDIFDSRTGEHHPHLELLNISVLSNKSIEESMVCVEDKEKYLFELTNTTAWNKIYKKDFLRKLNVRFQEIYVVDALYFTMTALCLAHKIGYFDRCLVHYRTGNSTGQLSNHDKNPTGVIDAITAVKMKLIEHAIYDKYEKIIMVYAVDLIMRRFHMLKGYEGTKKVYKLLHESIINSWNLESFCIEGKKSGRWISQIQEIKNTSFEEYLFNKISKAPSIVREKKYKLPTNILGKSIVLYGAGKVGKTFFVQLFNNNECRLQGWVDKSGDKIGFPVKSPEELKNLRYDLILIAIENKNIADEIMDELMLLGIPKDKLFWEYPSIV